MKNMSRHHLIAVAMIVITLAVFWKVHDHGFLWDDRVNVYENPYLNPVTLPGVLHFWQEPYQRLYIPLTYTVWASLARFAAIPATDESGANLSPRPFHVANLILHLLSMMVVFAILRTLVRDDWGACGGALLFSLHPVQVEPVAWVTGMKDVLSGFLSLVAVWQYLAYAIRTAATAKGMAGRHVEAPGGKSETLDLKGRGLHYAVATLAFVLALLAKPTAIVVPVVVWLLDHWVLRRSVRQSTVASVGWMAVAVPFIIVTKLAQPDVAVHFITPLWARPLVAGDALAFYSYKLVMPLWLGPDYARSPELVLRQGWIYLTWMVPCGLVIMAWLWRNRWPWLVASAGIFVVGVLPVSGLVPFSFQYVSTVADRYLYLSMLGPALALAQILSQHRRRLVPVSCVLILGLLGITSARQAQFWHDPERLWRHALAVTQDSSSAHYNLALVLDKRGELEEAIEHYRRALQINPADAYAHNNLGNALASGGELEEAIEHYRRALQVNPADAYAHNNLGNVLATQGYLDMAIDHFHQALRIQPDFAEAHESLGQALRQQGKRDEAIKHFEEALRIMKSGPEASAAR